ncbi:rcc01693 family protein [Yoonia sp.]|uniref:rcc01693 family protein n=1 Tax=Yoonia sp. TaxID=2212373 RepID=UPI003F6B1AD3
MDWPGLMRAGLHGLRLHPRDFWALTPSELQLMLGLSQAHMPMGRARLDDLLRAFPDTPKDMNDG